MNKIVKLFDDLKTTARCIGWAFSLLINKCKLYVIYRFLVSLFGTLIGILDLYMIRYAIKTLQEGETYTKSIIYIIILIMSYIIYSVLYEKISAIAKPYYKKNIKLAIKCEMFNKASNCDYSLYETPSYYDKYIIAMGNSESAIENILYSAIDLSSNLIGVFAAGTLSIIIDKFTLIFAVLPFIMTPIYKKSALLWKKAKNDTNIIERQTKYVSKVFSEKTYSKEIRLTNICKPLIDLYNNAIRDLKRIYIKYGLKKAMFYVLEESLRGFLSYHLILIYCAYGVLVSKTLQFGDCIVLVSVVESLYGSIDNILVNFKELYAGSLDITDIIEFLEMEPSVSNNSKVHAEPGVIEFRGVSFSYNMQDSNAISNVTFTINKGERIAIVGENGSGKSTIIKLLLRLYDPNQGAICINGKNIKEYDLSSYRNLFATVFQDYHLFAFSVLDNILMGQNFDEVKLNQSIEINEFSNVIERLPLGLNTMMGKEYDDNGVVFSGGQQQQLAISSAYFRDSNIMVYDEPSSALDPKAEAKFFENLLKLGENKTIIFISHRLSSAVYADRILFFSKGELVESGTHNELMNKNGCYAKMYKMQASGYFDDK